MKQLLWLSLLLSTHLMAATPSPTILIVGDSLSAAYGIEQKEGWVALLQQRMLEKRYAYRVVNSSISGDTTRSGVQRLPAELARVKPAIVLIELGANDGLRGLPLQDMRKNLEHMARSSLASGARVIIIGMQLPPNYGPAYTRAFANTYRDLAHQLTLPLVPFLLEGIGANKSAFLDDGLHPSATSQKQLLDNVWPVLEPLLQH